jgi:hypothetical protein
MQDFIRGQFVAGYCGILHECMHADPSLGRQGVFPFWQTNVSMRALRTVNLERGSVKEIAFDAIRHSETSHN